MKERKGERKKKIKKERKKERKQDRNRNKERENINGENVSPVLKSFFFLKIAKERKKVLVVVLVVVFVVGKTMSLDRRSCNCVHTYITSNVRKSH